MSYLPKATVVLLVGPVLTEFNLRNDDVDMMNFMLLGMLRGAASPKDVSAYVIK